MKSTDQLAKLIETGFAALSSDMADMRQDIVELRETMATRDDVRQIVESIGEPLITRASGLELELREIRRHLDLVEEHVGHMRGFSKELDQLHDRLRHVERHLGLATSIKA